MIKKTYSKKLRNDVISYIMEGVSCAIIMEKFNIRQIDIDRIYNLENKKDFRSHIFFRNYEIDKWYELPKDPFDFVIAWMHIQENTLKPFYRILTDDFDGKFKIIKV